MPCPSPSVLRKRLYLRAFDIREFVHWLVQDVKQSDFFFFEMFAGVPLLFAAEAGR
jgi:hypothetical protein